MQGGFLERGQLGGGLFDGVARGRAAGCGEVVAGSDLAQPGAEALQVAELGLSTDASIPRWRCPASVSLSHRLRVAVAIPSSCRAPYDRLRPPLQAVDGTLN